MILKLRPSGASLADTYTAYVAPDGPLLRKGRELLTQQGIPSSNDAPPFLTTPFSPKGIPFVEKGLLSFTRHAYAKNIVGGNKRKQKRMVRP